MSKIKTDRATLRKFGLIMAFCFTVVTLVIFFRHKGSWTPTSIMALSFLLVGLGRPALLKYFYILWMKLALILSWFNTRLLLCLIFYFLFSPGGLIMRLFRIDFLERNFKNACDSYWKPKKCTHSLPTDYERQF
jgi:hypothetical protein